MANGNRGLISIYLLCGNSCNEIRHKHVCVVKRKSRIHRHFRMIFFSIWIDLVCIQFRSCRKLLKKMLKRNNDDVGRHYVDQCVCWNFKLQSVFFSFFRHSYPTKNKKKKQEEIELIAIQL